MPATSPSTSKAEEKPALSTTAQNMAALSKESAAKSPSPSPSPSKPTQVSTSTFESVPPPVRNVVKDAKKEVAKEEAVPAAARIAPMPSDDKSMASSDTKSTSTLSKSPEKVAALDKPDNAAEEDEEEVLELFKGGPG
jgi:hypothetical protein